MFSSDGKTVWQTTTGCLLNLKMRKIKSSSFSVKTKFMLNQNNFLSYYYLYFQANSKYSDYCLFLKLHKYLRCKCCHFSSKAATFIERNKKFIVYGLRMNPANRYNTAFLEERWWWIKFQVMNFLLEWSDWLSEIISRCFSSKINFFKTDFWLVFHSLLFLN
jgi:hypothetical protein